MNKQQAIEIVEREPVGGAKYYSDYTNRFFNKILGVWYFFDGEWKACQPHIRVESNLTPMHEILEIALGEG